MVTGGAIGAVAGAFVFGALAAADTGGGVLSWQNPYSDPIAVDYLAINRTTKTTGAGTADFGWTTTNGTTLTIASGNTLTIATGGILYGSAVGGASTITGGTIVPGLGKELVVFANGKTLTINSVLGESAAGVTIARFMAVSE
mgnify:CR=1 FL=1